MGHAGFDAPAQRGDGGLAVAAVEIPGALPDHGYVRAMLPNFFCFTITSTSDDADQTAAMQRERVLRRQAAQPIAKA